MESNEITFSQRDYTPTNVGPIGEVHFDHTTGEIHVLDGVTPGGVILQSSAIRGYTPEIIIIDDIEDGSTQDTNVDWVKPMVGCAQPTNEDWEDLV